MMPRAKGNNTGTERAREMVSNARSRGGKKQVKHAHLSWVAEMVE